MLACTVIPAGRFAATCVESGWLSARLTMSARVSMPALLSCLMQCEQHLDRRQPGVCGTAPLQEHLLGETQALLIFGEP